MCVLFLTVMFIDIYSQDKAFIPHRVQSGTNSLGFLLAVALGVWNKFELDVGVRQPVRVHGNQIPGFTYYKYRKH